MTYNDASLILGLAILGIFTIVVAWVLFDNNSLSDDNQKE